MKAYVERLKVLRGRVMSVLVPLLFVATLASAEPASGSGSGGMSPLTMLFLGVLAAIILLQLIPALILFGSMVTAVFKRSVKKAEATSREEA